MLPHLLYNTDAIELWPARLLRARCNHSARTLAQARRVLRRKRDGRYLAVETGDRLLPLIPHVRREPGIAAALHVLQSPLAPHTAACLPVARLRQRLQALGLDVHDYAARTGLALVAEPVVLHLAGLDRYRRPLWLCVDAARAWRRMQQAARREEVELDAVSGYRSHEYQAGIIARKRAHGLGLCEILAVNAAPGFSEHHSARALDIGTPGEPAAETSFEQTPAFAWLCAHAGRFGFRMSYPRDNPHGIVYEPWHWCWHAQ